MPPRAPKFSSDMKPPYSPWFQYEEGVDLPLWKRTRQTRPAFPAYLLGWELSMQHIKDRLDPNNEHGGLTHVLERALIDAWFDQGLVEKYGPKSYPKYWYGGIDTEVTVLIWFDINCTMKNSMQRKREVIPKLLKDAQKLLGTDQPPLWYDVRALHCPDSDEKDAPKDMHSGESSDSSL